MGKQMLDQYSLLHFSVGVIMYFWGISFNTWFTLHLLFEIVENTHVGMNIINKYITMWPGGKPYADSTINSVFDQVLALLGWMLAFYLDKIFR